MTDAAVPAVQPEAERDQLAVVSGSDSTRFRNTLLNDLRAVVVQAGASEDVQTTRFGAAVDALRGFAPRNEIEGMMAAQAVALHHAVMDALRRAMTPGIPAETSDRLRRQAVKLSNAFTDLAETIERRRNGGTTRQIVRIERVVVEDGGQAMVGAIAASLPGRG